MPSLMETLWALHESPAESDGTGTYIMQNGRYLSGIPYLWSQFGERAFIFQSKMAAEDLIRRFPAELMGAEVHQRTPVA